MPANEQVQQTSKMKSSVEKMTKVQLQKLKAGDKVDVYHRSSADTQSRLVVEGCPVAMLKAFSGSFGDNLLNKKQVTVTGGDVDSVKAIIKWTFAYCNDKKAKPAPAGPELCFWMQMHQTAVILDAPLFAGIAMAEVKNYLERIADPANVDAVAQVFPATSRYVKMVVPNVARAVVNWWSGYHSGCIFLGHLEETYPAFYAVLKTEVKKQQAAADKVAKAKFSVLTPEETQAKIKAYDLAQKQAKAERDAKWWAAEKERHHKVLAAEAAMLRKRRALLAETTVWSKIAAKKPEMAPLPAPVAKPFGMDPDAASWGPGFK